MQFYGIVRDKNGKPRIDNPADVPQALRDTFTDDDLLKMDQQEIELMGFSARLASIKAQRGL